MGRKWFGAPLLLTVWRGGVVVSVHQIDRDHFEVFRDGELVAFVSYPSPAIRAELEKII